MRVIAMIPARYAATRFPGKLMQELKGKAVILHTYEATIAAGLFDDVFVITDSDMIYSAIHSSGGKAVMSLREHESGTDRIAEAAEKMKADIIINVQGDTPFVSKKPLEALVNQFKDPSVQVGSLMQELTDPAALADENFVKVTVDKNMNALFFSRSVIPFPRNKSAKITYYEHIGVYAFRRQALLDFTTWPLSPLENAEKIECLRYLENGVGIRMVLTDYLGVEIDTPDDLKKAEGLL